MLSRLFGRGRVRLAIATALYGAIVAQARSPGLYAGLGVPDTVSGRFEMVILHAFLVFSRLQVGSVAEREASQEAFDLFCADMDRSLRELGVGDLGVPKRMKQVGEAFYGRSKAYAECIERGDVGALAAALGRNVLKTAPDDAALPLARYAMASAARLGETQPSASGNRAGAVPRSRGICADACCGGHSVTAPILSRPVQVGGIHGSTEVAVVATADERVALAAEYDMLDVKALSSTATVTPGPDGAVEVAGQVTADIVQACVVTLVPVEQHIDERFSVRFVRPGSPELVPERPNAELVVDAEAPDPPELLSGTSLDVGAIVEEAFVLGIDPYPRAPGAVLPQAGDDPDPAAESPFAVLARLKGKR